MLAVCGTLDETIRIFWIEFSLSDGVVSIPQSFAIHGSPIKREGFVLLVVVQPPFASVIPYRYRSARTEFGISMSPGTML